MCVPNLFGIKQPQTQTPGGAPPPNQPAATINQPLAINPRLNDASLMASSRGVSGLTIPLMAKPSLGGIGPSGLGIPTS